jgi:mono/diheme cytochrome c family protein
MRALRTLTSGHTPAIAVVLTLTGLSTPAAWPSAWDPDSPGTSVSVARARARASAVSRSQQDASAGTGSYTESQADRGKTAYEASCSSCHGASLRGGANEFAAPALAGPFFYEKWLGRPMGELFRYAAETMPPDQARLSESTYLDITAYILQVLKYPAGTTDLTTDSPAMKRAIERK